MLVKKPKITSYTLKNKKTQKKLLSTPLLYSYLLIYNYQSRCGRYNRSGRRNDYEIIYKLDLNTDK
jgi:hypothetical protein